MSDYTREQELRARYGDVNVMSAEVNPENPGFDSLLGALKAVHTGEMGMDVLVRYHEALGEQLAASRDTITHLPEPEGMEGVAADQVALALSSLAMVQAMLDALARYIEEPSQERVGIVVDRLLQSQRIIRDVNAFLDQRIREGLGGGRRAIIGQGSGESES